MKSTATASLEFDFRGQRYKPAISIDLDAIMQRQGNLNGLHDLLATSIGLDSYTHEYDVLIMEEIIFSEATGLACQFIHEGRFNFDGFIGVWETQKILSIIHPIAEKHLNISDNSHHKNIEKALIESYKAGQKNNSEQTAKRPDPHSDFF